jgi:protein O-mannosyl-transferase
VWQAACVCVILVLAVLAVFGQTAGFGFVNYDDDQYVFENPVVEKGLSVEAVGWAFTHAQVANWTPLSTLSHMLDCQMFGLHAGGHHLVNVLWHAANAVLLFLVLRQMTGSLWRSAFVAAVFAIHSLRAESVAWVSERKDVLSAFFFMLAIGAYVRYAQEFKVQSSKFKVLYSLCLVFFVLGLMSKPMVATLPFVLLLLDYWPLGRFQDAPQFLRLVKEKIPFFALAAGACVATALVPGLVITDARRLPLLERFGNALVSDVVYVRQMVFPAGLAVPYPLPPNGYAIWQVGLALVFVAAITAGLVLWRKKRPALLVGWFWYLGMLFPVIGIIQISADAARADRYTYLPGIGLALALTWAVADGSAGWKNRKLILGGSMLAVVGALGICGHRQTSYWKDSATLWRHVLACTSGNSLANNNLGVALAAKGDLAAAIVQYQKALEIKPDYSEALNNLGVALVAKGDVEAAIVQYQKALEIKPDYVEVRYNLGSALAGQGEYEAAITQYRKALEIKPDYAEALNNLGAALASKGEYAAAITQYRNALGIKPDYAEGRYNLGNALFAQGDKDAAIAQLQKALEIKPDYAEARNNLGSALSEKGDKNGAIAQFQKALEIKPDFAEARNNLASALSEKGDNNAAIAQLQKAVQIKPDNVEARNKLGAALYAKGDLEAAIVQYQKALEIKPDYAEARNSLGAALYAKGDLEAAIAQYRKVLEIEPDYAEARNNLGSALASKGEYEGAIAQYRKALGIKPDYLEAQNNLGKALFMKGDLAEAVAQYQNILKITPRSADTYGHLGEALLQKGETKEAVDSWQKSLEINSGQVNVQKALAWVLATTPEAALRNGPKAMALAAQANQLSGGGNPMILRILAAAHAETGSYGQAVDTARRALELAKTQKNDALAAALQKEIKFYEANTPVRDAPRRASN